MNEVLKCLIERRSARAFKNEPLKKEDIELIIEAGKYAPNGMGKQAPIFVVTTDPEKIAELSKLNASIMNSNGDPFYGAVCVITVLADSNVGTYVYDGSLALGNMQNAAWSLGIAGCWIHRAKEMYETEKGKAIKEQLGIGDEYVGIGNLILGYAKDEPAKAKDRKENSVFYY
ncbi:MAG: nitroreductase [Eubacteriaceae bacterium]|nr:nitroreductase [Eubacteriaceae bacterium]